MCKFPLFMDLSNKTIIIVGSGKIAQRRLETLLNFSNKITIISPTANSELDNTKNIIILNRKFMPSDIEKAFLVLACTNDSNLNSEIFHLCKSKKILVNNCSDKDECDFFFPAIFENENIIGGIVSKSGNNHKLVKYTAQKIRNIL